MVPMAGVEPARVTPPPPQDGVSTNFTTSAYYSMFFVFTGAQASESTPLHLRLIVEKCLNHRRYFILQLGHRWQVYHWLLEDLALLEYPPLELPQTAQ